MHAKYVSLLPFHYLPACYALSAAVDAHHDRYNLHIVIIPVWFYDGRYLSAAVDFDVCAFRPQPRGVSLESISCTVFRLCDCQCIVFAQGKLRQQFQRRGEDDEQNNSCDDCLHERCGPQPFRCYSTHTTSFLRRVSYPASHSGCAVAVFSSNVRSYNIFM